MSYTLSILRRAENDVECIYRWISSRSQIGAVHWHEAYVQAIFDLKRNPLSSGFAEESALARKGLRQRIFKTQSGRNYRILFSVAGNELRILRVRGPGQPPLRRNQI